MRCLISGISSYPRPAKPTARIRAAHLAVKVIPALLSLLPCALIMICLAYPPAHLPASPSHVRLQLRRHLMTPLAPPPPPPAHPTASVRV